MALSRVASSAAGHPLLGGAHPADGLVEAARRQDAVAREPSRGRRRAGPAAGSRARRRVRRMPAAGWPSPARTRVRVVLPGAVAADEADLVARADRKVAPSRSRRAPARRSMPEAEMVTRTEFYWRSRPVPTALPRPRAIRQAATWSRLRGNDGTRVGGWARRRAGHARTTVRSRRGVRRVGSVRVVVAAVVGRVRVRGRRGRRGVGCGWPGPRRCATGSCRPGWCR